MDEYYWSCQPTAPNSPGCDCCDSCPNSNDQLDSSDSSSSRRLSQNSNDITAGAASHAAALWDQCGGSSGCDDTTHQPCADGRWSGLVCPGGSTCQRQDAWFWQCVPIADSSVKAPTPATTAVGGLVVAASAGTGGAAAPNSVVHAAANVSTKMCGCASVAPAGQAYMQCGGLGGACGKGGGAQQLPCRDAQVLNCPAGAMPCVFKCYMLPLYACVSLTCL